MRKEFIDIGSRLVNLQNVSNINVLHNMSRIIFNMNYNIEIHKRGEPTLISDYCYWDLPSHVSMEDAINILEKNSYYNSNFITYENSSININEISSIKFSDKKNRIIFNLSHPISFVDYNQIKSVTSAFVFFNYEDHDSYVSSMNIIKQLIKE